MRENGLPFEHARFWACGVDAIGALWVLEAWGTRIAFIARQQWGIEVELPEKSIVCMTTARATKSPCPAPVTRRFWVRRLPFSLPPKALAQHPYPIDSGSRGSRSACHQKPLPSTRNQPSVAPPPNPQLSGHPAGAPKDTTTHGILTHSNSH